MPGSTSPPYFPLELTMTRIEVRQWNMQFDRPGMLDLVRRKIAGSQANGTVLVDFESTILNAEQVAYLMAGWAPSKVKFCGSVLSLPHPVPENALLPEVPQPRRRRRSRPSGPEEPRQ